MITDEKVGSEREKEPEKGPTKKILINRQQMEKSVPIIAVAILLFMAICVLPFNMRSDVKKIVESSENKKLCDIAKEKHYKTLSVLDEIVDYVIYLEAEKSFISENEGLRRDVQALTTRLEILEQRMDRPDPVSETPDLTPFCRLFTSELDENKGEVYIEDQADTMTYVVYVPKSKSGETWEQYDRVEVDMYKRSGQWEREDSQKISAVLSEAVEEGSYRICIFLRTDVDGRRGNSGNGGYVTFSVGDQTVSSGLLQQTRMGKNKGEDEIVSIHGGEEIELIINPEDGNDFFSFAICIDKETQSVGGGMSRD